MKTFGSICVKHPELNGHRYAISRKGRIIPSNCLGCRAESRKSPKSLAYLDAWRAVNADKNREYARRAREKHPHLWNKDKAQRRAEKLRATPAWADKSKIGEIYKLAALKTKTSGYPWHVDHIIPLRSAVVCGLHVESNLRVVPGIFNLIKRNRYEV